MLGFLQQASDGDGMSAQILRRVHREMSADREEGMSVL